MNTNWLSRYIPPLLGRRKMSPNLRRNKLKHVLTLSLLATGMGTNAYALSGPTADQSGEFTLTYPAGRPGMMDTKNKKIEVFRNGTKIDDIGLPPLSSSKAISVSSTGTYLFKHYTQRMTCLQWFMPRNRGCAEPGEFVESYAGSHTVEVTSVPMPSSLSYSSSYQTGNFTVSWSASSGAEEYVLQHKVGATGPWTQEYRGSNRSYPQSDLTPGIHQYRVSACKGNICSSFRLGSSFEVIERPSIPSITVPSYSSSSTATIRWAKGSGGGRVDRYDVDFSKDGGTWTHFNNDASTSRTATNLAHESTYRYRVRACNIQCSDFRYGSNSLYVEYKPGKPGISTNQSGASTNGSYNIAWSPADDFATEYRLTENGQAEYTGTALSRNILNHANGTYTYVVSACNSRNVCTASDPLRVTVSITLPAPGGFSASPNPVYNGDRTTLTWNSIGGNHPIYYELKTPQNTRINKGSARSHVLEDLAKGSHTYTVRACSSVNSGVCSSETSRTITSDYIVGAPPLTAPTRAYQGYQVTWSASGNATQYELQLSTNGGNFTTVQNTSARSFSYSVTRPNHQYGQHRYRIRARNAAGWSSYGPIKTVYNTSLVEGFRASKNPSYNGEAIEIIWNSVPGNITYQVRLPNGNFVTPSGTNRHAISGLTSGNHAYGVRACTTASMGQCSPVVELALTSVYRPSVPQNFSASYPGNYSSGAYSLNWSLVSGATSYELTRSINGGSFTAVSGYNGTANTFNYTPGSGHVNGQHVYRLRARNAAGYSGYTPLVNIVVLPAVTGLRADPSFVRNGEATVIQWNADSSPKISYKLAQSGVSTDRVLGNVGSHSVSNLPFGDHTFTVKACFADNIALCNSGSSVTVESLYRPSKPARPSAPTSSNGNYRVSWTAVSGADSYTLERSVNGGAWITAANGSGLVYDYVVNGSHQDGAHRYRVIATNEAGDSDVSDASTVVVVSPVNSLNVDPQTTLNDQVATIGWQARSGWPIDFFLRLPNGTELDLGGSNSYQLSNLEHGSHQYGVKACYAVNSAICSPLATVTVQTIITPSKPTVLNVPANVDPSDSGYAVTWSSVLRADNYVLQQAVNSDSFVTVYQGSGRSYTVNFADMDNPYGEHR